MIARSHINMVLIKTRFISNFLELILLTVVFTFENMRFLKMAKTNIERAKNLFICIYDIDVRGNLCNRY